MNSKRTFFITFCRQHIHIYIYIKLYFKITFIQFLLYASKKINRFLIYIFIKKKNISTIIQRNNIILSISLKLVQCIIQSQVYN